MNSLIVDAQAEIDKLCRRFRVRRLELFGSAARDDFDPTRSDVDFLVEFLSLQPGEYADSYFGLLEELEKLFARPINLVMLTAVKNPYFLENIESSRTLIYED